GGLGAGAAAVPVVRRAQWGGGLPDLVHVGQPDPGRHRGRLGCRGRPLAELRPEHHGAHGDRRGLAEERPATYRLGILRAVRPAVLSRPGGQPAFVAGPPALPNRRPALATRSAHPPRTPRRRNRPPPPPPP